jgi:hypothetical protein
LLIKRPLQVSVSSKQPAVCTTQVGTVLRGRDVPRFFQADAVAQQGLAGIQAEALDELLARVAAPVLRKTAYLSSSCMSI